MADSTTAIQVRGQMVGSSDTVLSIRLSIEQGERPDAATIHGDNVALIPWPVAPEAMIDLHISNPWLGAIANVIADACSSAQVDLVPDSEDTAEDAEYERGMAWLERNCMARDGELELDLSGFLRTAALHWDATGNLFLESVRDARGLAPFVLAFLLPQFVWYERVWSELRLVQRAPTLGETVFKPFGTRKNLRDPHEFIHHRLPNLVSSAYGLPAWISSRDSVALDNAHRKYLAGFFKNHGTPRWMIQVTADPTWTGASPDPTHLDSIYAIINSFLTANKGDMSGRNLMLQFPGGIIVTAQPLDHKLEDPTFGQTAKNARDEILAVRHVSLVDLGLPEGGYRATAGIQSNNFRVQVLEPHIAPAIAVLNRVLTSPAPYGLGLIGWRLEAKFDRPEEALAKVEAIIKATGTPFMTPNEGRDLAGYEKHAGTAADTIYINAGLVPLEEVAAGIVSADQAAAMLEPVPVTTDDSTAA